MAKKRIGNLMAIQEGRFTTTSLATVVEKKSMVDLEKFYDIDQYRPKEVNPKDFSAFF